MANEHGSEQERGADGNSAVPRHQGTDIGLDYNQLPVPREEVGSVDATGAQRLRSSWIAKGDSIDCVDCAM
jgi:hypothetical protein